MSDPMGDEDLIAILEKAVEPYSSDWEPASAAVHMMLDAIRSAGYRIVKPDAEWADFSAYVPDCDDFPGYRKAHADGDREFAIETILEDSDETHDLFETITVPVSRASLLAELESMKEAGE